MTLPLDNWDRMLAINLTGAFITAQRAAQIMVESGGGKIINMCSIASFGALDRPGGYDVSKAGLEMLTKDMANELAEKGVGVNAIAPGFLETEMTRALREDGDWVARTLAVTPEGRLGKPSEVVGAAIFLAGGASSHLHGATIVVDGGRMARA